MERNKAVPTRVVRLIGGYESDKRVRLLVGYDSVLYQHVWGE